VTAPRTISPDFIRAHTRLERSPVVPEVQLHVASDVVALWEAMETEAGGAGEAPPFWAAAWPGGVALARYVLDHPEVVAGRPVLDLGSGSGLVAVAARLAGSGPVVASDVDPYSHAAVPLNADANGVDGITVAGDVLDDEPPADAVVLAGDVCYDREMTARVLPWLFRAWTRGSVVLLGDPGRAYAPEGITEVAAYEVPDTEGGAGAGLVRRTAVLSLP
jgi:predicted nicotinamide N-methyase